MAPRILQSIQPRSGAGKQRDGTPSAPARSTVLDAVFVTVALFTAPRPLARPAAGAPLTGSTLTPAVRVTVSPPPAVSASTHVRCLDVLARHILAAGLLRSPTLARMVDDLQATDVVVEIQTVSALRIARGKVLIVAATPDLRYLRLVLGVPGAGSTLIEVLGHEIRHALEIAAMPEVRDAASLAVAYRRIGYARAGAGFFETDAALDAGRRVREEFTSR